MPPDLNTLPISRSPSGPGSPVTSRPRRISISTQDAARSSPPSPRSPSLSSLQAAATINAGLHRSSSRASPIAERRRSSLMNNLLINDPAIPAPGELQQGNSGNASNAGSPRLRSFALSADPHHHRQPSLGELHQELENEQEAQVNRLLHMIRIQQDQLASIQRQRSQTTEETTTSAEQPWYPTPPSTLVPSASIAANEAPSSAQSNHASPSNGPPAQFNRPHSLSRRSSALISAPGSRGTSPAARPQASNLGPLTEDFLLGGTRDETVFYQAETQNLTRENQMLKLRIRELEHQIAALGGGTGAASNPTHQHSPLASPPATLPEAQPAVVADGTSNLVSKD